MIYDSDRAKDKMGDNYPIFNNNEKGYTPEELAKKAIKIDGYTNIKKAIKRYGLEGTEEVIKINYKNIPKAKELLLKILYEIWKG